MSFLALSSILMLGAVPPAPDGAEILRSSAELEAFADDPHRRYTPFCITGVVQAVDVGHARQLVFSDATDWVEIRTDADYRPAPGEEIAVSGFAHMSSHQEVDIVAKKIVPVGMTTPADVLTLRLGDISEHDHQLRPVKTEGVVIDSFPDEVDPHNRFLVLKDADTVLPVAVPVDPDTDPAALRNLHDARVRVNGRFYRTVNGVRKFSGPFVSLRTASDITVLSPAPDDPFDVPPLERTLYRTPREIASLGKRSVSGELLAAWDGNRLMVRETNGRIVNVTLAHGQTAPAPGRTVTVAGYPETDLFRLNLSRAAVREDATSLPPKEEPVAGLEEAYPAADAKQPIDPRYHGRLMRVTGVVQSLPSPDDTGRRLLLVCGSHKLPVDLGSCPRDILDDIEPGARIEATGRGLLEVDSWRPDDIFPRIKSLTLVLRAPADLRLLVPPPWWTPRRLSVVISILLAALIGSHVWNRILRRLVQCRGHELYREQVAHAIAEFKTSERTRLAVELHDSLSQTLAGVACHVSTGGDMIETDPATAKRCIETADKMLDSCRAELRNCLFDLRSDTLEEPNFMTAITRTLEQLDTDAAITVRFHVPRARIKDSIAHAILAIIRELTGNALRHGKAAKVQVAGCIDNGNVVFSVTDNGSGFDPGNCNGPRQGHFGLEGIRDRVRKIGGTFTLDSRPGAGARAVVTIPLPAATPPDPQPRR